MGDRVKLATKNIFCGAPQANSLGKHRRRNAVVRARLLVWVAKGRREDVSLGKGQVRQGDVEIASKMETTNRKETKIDAERESEAKIELRLKLRNTAQRNWLGLAGGAFLRKRT